MAQLFINDFLVNLAEAIFAVDTSFDLTDTSRLPALTGGDFIVLRIYRRVRDAEFRIEYIKVTGISGNTITCERAYDGSTALDYVEGTFVGNFIDSTYLESMGTYNIDGGDAATDYSVSDITIDGGSA